MGVPRKSTLATTFPPFCLHRLEQTDALPGQPI
jgi:hypothetical protein